MLEKEKKIKNAAYHVSHFFFSISVTKTCFNLTLDFNQKKQFSQSHPYQILTLP